MKYAVGFFGDRVWMVNPYSMSSGTPFFPPTVHVTEGELRRGKGWTFLRNHYEVFVEAYPNRFDRIMGKPSMAKLPWQIYGGGK